MRQRLRVAPAEGWLTLALVAVMCVTMAWAIDDARYVLGRPEYLDLLMYAALGGVLAGFIGPKVGWSRWLTFLIGAIFAALLIPLLVALVDHPFGVAPHDLSVLYGATASAAVEAYLDIAVRGLSTTPQYLHHILVFGLIVWATSMFASYAVFGHHRPLGGIVVVGLILVANMSITDRPQLPYMVLFSIAALLILIRSHVYDEESEWIRRRIGDPGTISAVYLRGGTVFIAVTVVASFVLTQTAASAPLAGAWDGVQDNILAVSRAVSRILPTGGSTRSLGPTFGEGPLGQVWTQEAGVAVIILRNPQDPTPYYWRAETYDQLDLKGRGHSQTSSADLAVGTSIFDQLPVAADPATLHQVEFAVTPVEFRQSRIISPADPDLVDVPARLETTGASGNFAYLDRSSGSGDYSVTARVVIGDGPGQLTESALRATGRNYPDDIQQLYLQLPEGMFGDYAKALKATIVARAGSTDPYDLAKAAEVELATGPYTYDRDITDLHCENESAVECFAQYRRGFCQYYAITMAAILRDLGVPTRIAEGFLPGVRSGPTETIALSNAHEWVEVYFDGYGWVQFDPTPAGVSQLAPLPSGKPVASRSPGPSRSPLAQASRVAGPQEGPGGPSGHVDSTASGSLGPMVGVGILLLIVILTASFLAWRRGPRSAINADGAYGTVVRIASRLGFGPRPAETVYEYAGALGDVLPDVRPELHTVATAKVESAYGRRIIDAQRLATIQTAQRRLRVSLLKLAFRRQGRKRR